GQNRLLEADKAINEAATRDSGNARYLYLQGRVADAIGKAEEAYRKYEAALKAKPDLVEALAAEGLVWVSRNDKARAQERLDVALKVPTDSLTAVEEEAIGDLALSMGHRDKARDAFARALQKDPNDPIAHAGMGKALAAQGDLAAARKQMEMALTQLETDAALQYEYGSLLRRMGQSDGALQSFRKAVKLDSKEALHRPRLWALVGDAEQQSGDIDSAIRDFQRALAQDPNLPSVWTKLGIAYKDKDCRGCRTKAVDALQRATRVDPGDALAHHELGYMFK